MALPLVFFVVPALFGHPAISGDNLIQNFPLRALSGEQMRQGHLPLWNPFIWSGSPLLGGLNAGSFYPFTFAFVVLPPVAAWVLNLLGVYWAGGLGMYALARQYRLRPPAALLGALTYAFSGTMSGQLVHLGVIEGMGWMPLLVLAELRLSWAVLGTAPARAVHSDAAPPRAVDSDAAPARGASPWPWVALLAAVIGLEALTGEPRSMAETEIVAPAVVLWLVLRPYARPVAPARRAHLIGLAVLAGLWGAALAAAELAPGWSFIQASQRSAQTYHFFGSGSLPVHWTVLLFVPDLFGGNGLFGQQHFFNHYNLPEVTGYVGLLPLVAALALLTRSFGRRRSRMASDWGMWLALAVLGLFLAWGSYTPLGHVWAQIPLFGKTRLQSRNLEIVDLALAVLFAFFVDGLLGGERVTGLSGWRRWVAVVPAVASAALCVAALAWPVGLEEAFGATARGGGLARSLWPWFGAEICIAAAVAGLVLGWRRLPLRARRGFLAAIVVADVGLFVLATSTATNPPTATLGPTHAAAVAVLGDRGRFGIYDTTAANIPTASAIGQPDLNAFSEVPSVQGYGSIVAQAYGSATGTHTLNSLNACDLEEGRFRALRLATLAVLPAALAPGVGQDGRPPPRPPPCPGIPTPGTAHRRTLYLGWPLALSGATLVALHHTSAVPTVALLTASGKTRVPAASVRPTPTGWHVRFRRPQVAVALVIEGPARDVADTSTVTGATGGVWALDGVLQDALDTSAWRFAGSWNMYGIFEERHVPPPVWLSGAAPGSTVRQVQATDWGSTEDAVVAARPVTVVWSEAYMKGWHAELTPSGGGATRDVPVRPDGLVQSVRVPAGSWTLRFVYRPPRLTPGIAASLVGLAGFVALGVASAAGRRRSRRPSRGLPQGSRPQGSR